MARDSTMSPDVRRVATPGDDAWDALKRRLKPGQVVEGVVAQSETFGVFFDIGEKFPAFVDPPDLPPQPLRPGDRCRLKVLQLADWDHQVRAMLAPGN
jgi:ribosomal protein S1